MKETLVGEIAGDLDEEAISRIKSELDPGERLLWAGRPRQVSTDFSTGFKVFSVIAFILFLYGVAALGTVARNRFGVIEWVEGLGILCGLVDVFILLFMVGIRISIKLSAIIASRTLFALSDRRAMAWIPGFNKRGAMRVFSLHRGEISGVSRVEFPDGSGDVVFGQRRGDPEIFEPLPFNGFRGIETVRRVEEQVRRTLLPDRKEL